MCNHHVMKASLLASALARMLDGRYVSHTETHEQAGYVCFFYEYLIEFIMWTYKTHT